MIATSNRLLPLLAGGVVLMLGFVTLKSCTGEQGDQLTMESVPQAPSPDADTPADTIKTLTANVAAMTSEVKALRLDNATLHKENKRLLGNRTQIENNVATRVKRELLSREKNQAISQRLDSGVLSSLTERMDALSQSFSQINTTSRGNDIPVGLGLDGMSANHSAEHLVWVEPLEQGDDGSIKTKGPGLLHQTRQSASSVL
ncbi:MAG: hypothetical protein GY934_24585, partial [Gammaproteobacteria bacterium]|nr:hypothetical protein [Gammaproteobacteria bacterium]